MPLRAIVTPATQPDCCHAQALIEGFEAEHLIADKGYDTEATIQKATEQGIQPQIPPRRHRKLQRPYDKHLYQHRHLVENAFAHIKQWRGIATRYAKNAASFVAAINIRCLILWLDIS